MTAFLAWLWAFLFGQAIEAPLYAFALRRSPRPPPPGRRLLLALLPTTLTHPIVWFVFPLLVPEPYWLMGALAEAFAVGAEAAVLRACGVSPGWPWALCGNAMSCGLGLLSRALIGWP